MDDHQRAVGNEAGESRCEIVFMTTLRELPVGTVAKVVNVHGKGAVSKRLMEMGLIPGTEIRVIKSAPFGDPIQVRVLGYSLALRRNEAASIEIVRG
jgi:Fe2+ transport system protein FeoA